MDFGRVLTLLIGFFERQQAPVALVGGFAMQALGHSRLTFDLDLITRREVQPRLLAFMESLGYETLHASPGYSNHLHADFAWGRVDFVYTDEPTAGKLFSASTPRKLFGTSIAVPRPEHLAAMKVLAMKNDPSRTFSEMSDLQFLLSLPEVDRSEVREYFARHGLLSRFDELTKAT